jgi:prophage regulatory protein
MTPGFNFKTKPTTPASKATTVPVVLAPMATIIPMTQSVFDLLPDNAWLRESQLVRSSKSADSAVAPLPFSAPTLWRKVAAGTFPKPVKLSERVTCWKVSEVRAWMAAHAMTHANTKKKPTDVIDTNNFSTTCRENYSKIRSDNGLPPDQRAVTLMCKFAMLGYLVYPNSNGTYRVGMNGTLKYVESTDTLEELAKKLGVLA